MKLTELLAAVDKKVKLTKKRLDENKESADLSSKTARTSWSAAGEREYTAGQLAINQKAFDQIIKLQEEIVKCVDVDAPEKIAVPCYVSIKTNDTVSNVFIVKNVTTVDGFNLVSSESDMGKVLLGKQVGDKAETSVGTDVEVVEIG